MQIEEQSEELLAQKEELKIQRDHLNELNTTKDKLFSILGHDLRSPFNSILGFSDLLYLNFRNYTEEKIETQIGYIKDTARNTFYLLNNLLEWSRSQQGAMHIEPEKISVSELIQSDIRLLTQQATRKEVIISLSIIGNESIIEADPNMLSTVIRNLISNAIKFSNKDNIVSVVLQFENESFSFSVIDQGVGMTAEKIDSLFKVGTNESTNGTSGEKGIGLGLLLCADFIAKHNGKIWVESEEGQGSTFSFSIHINQ